VSALTSALPGKVESVPAGFEEKLVWLCRFGQPSLRMMDRGWHANIEMNTNTTGSSFKVATEFTMQSPAAAVDQLIKRMLAMLAAMNGGQP